VVIMRLDRRVPHAANCLSFDSRYVSEEFPEVQPGLRRLYL
jgi:hypothetical protein